MAQIGKLDVAARLVDEAIRGLLRGDDALAVHLSAFSAVRVTADLRQHRGLGQSPFDEYVKPEATRALWKAFYTINSFMKHADRDPDGTIDDDHASNVNDVALLVASQNLEALGIPLKASFWRAYHQWRFVFEHPHVAETPGDDHAKNWEMLAMAWTKVDHPWVADLARDPVRHAEDIAKLHGFIQLPTSSLLLPDGWVDIVSRN